MKNKIQEYLNKKKFKFLRKIFLKLQPFFKKDSYILFDNLYEANAECIDTYCIFQYMQKHGIKSYYVIWKENPLYKKLKKENQLKNILVMKRSCRENIKNNFDFFFLTWRKLFSAKAVITSFGELNKKITELLHKNREISYIHTDHGSIFLKTFILSIGLFSPNKFNKFLICSETESKIFQRFGWDKNNLIKIGLPRWDLLKKEPQPQKNIFMMFTWRNSFGKWNTNFTTPLTKTEYYKGIMAFIRNPKLQRLLKENNVKLIYTLHHSLINQCREKLDFSDSHLEYVPCENISQYIGKADMFITDYSSLFFDFAFLHTPIVFYRPDFDDTTLNENDRGDMEHAKTMDNKLFNICYTIDGAVAAIEKYIKNGFVLEVKNCQKADALFSTKKNITQKFVAYLEKM